MPAIDDLSFGYRALRAAPRVSGLSRSDLVPWPFAAQALRPVSARSGRPWQLLIRYCANEILLWAQFRNEEEVGASLEDIDAHAIGS
jgi:hypothetical protein